MMLSLAAWLDRKEAQLRRVGERIGWPQAWLQEWIAYSGDSRMTLEEFYVRFTLLRMETKPRFDAVKTEADARAFYQTSDYMLWRNLVHRRHSAWRRVLWTMPRGWSGNLYEVGCGIAPISAWVSRYRPRWLYALIDLNSPHRAYAGWRVGERGMPTSVVPSAPACVITLVDVLEHLPDPLAMAKRCVASLRPGGYLHVNFVGNPQMNDLDLASPEQREATLAYLDSALTTVWSQDGYTVRRK